MAQGIRGRKRFDFLILLAKLILSKIPSFSFLNKFLNVVASGTKTLTAVVAESSTAPLLSSELKGPISDTVADALGPTPLLVSNSIEDVARVPNCPNGLKPMQYVDGRPVMCLPGRNQCPNNSVCFFNGVDFFCCPNAEDPYDLHVFGGEQLFLFRFTFFKNVFISEKEKENQRTKIR